MLPNIFSVLRGAAASKAPEPAPEAPPVPRPPAGPPRYVEGRLEFRGMLWKPALEVLDEEKLVVGAKAGLPHCARCERALTLEAAPEERWRCATCGRAHPGIDADFFAAETVAAHAVREFLAAHPGFAAVAAFSAPKTS